MKYGKQLLIYCLLTGAMLLGYPLDGMISFGVYACAMYCCNVWISTLLYLAVSATQGTVLFALTRAAVLILFALLHRLLKRKANRLLYILYCVLANAVYCIGVWSDVALFMDRLLSTAVGTAFALVCIYAFRAVFVKGLSYRPALDEMLSVAIFATVMSYCLSLFNVGFDIAEGVTVFVVLAIMSVKGEFPALSAAVTLSMGNALATAQFQSTAILCILALCAVVLNRVNRYASAFFTAVGYILLVYLWKGEQYLFNLSFLPVGVAVISFVIIPDRWIKNLRQKYGDGKNDGARNAVNRLRWGLSARLYRLSDVFFAMKNTFTSMADGATTADDAREQIVRCVTEEVCNDCPHRSLCWRDNRKLAEKSLTDLVYTALQRGRISILDIDSNLTARCERLNGILTRINARAVAFKDYCNRTAQSDSSKLLIGEQLGGVSAIMQNMAVSLKGRVTFQADKERDLLENLSFHNIRATEASLMESNGEKSVILTVDKKDADMHNVEKIVSESVGLPMRTERAMADGEYITAYMLPKPRYELSYGIRSAAKEGKTVSGDTHSFVGIDNSKVMLAVCDGMGSGEKAEKMSETAITLVENFYRAGFSSELILSCVNRLMQTFNNETFCAVDIVVADLSNGRCDFVKLGAPESFVRQQGETSVVNGSSLPLGVLEEMKPSTCYRILGNGDLIVLCSDGITDCLGSESISDYLNQTVLTNPQIIADELMEEALAKCNNIPKDDMTIVVARIV